MLNPLILIFLTIVLLIIIYSFFIEPFNIKHNKISLPMKVQSSGKKPISILHVSDLHFKGNDQRKIRLFERLGENKFDLILITGDFIDNDRGIEDCTHAVSRLNSAYGIYGVLGNHDRFYHKWYSFPLILLLKKCTMGRREQNDVQRLTRSFKEIELGLLINEEVIININGLTVAIIGIDDFNTGHPDIKKALRGIPDNVYKIFLTHTPDGIDKDVEKACDLILAGHTHGGQARIPLLGAVFTGSRRIVNRRKTSGMFLLGEKRVHISPGIGTDRFHPYRFLSRPEVTEIELIPCNS